MKANTTKKKVKTVSKRHVIVGNDGFNSMNWGKVQGGNALMTTDHIHPQDATLALIERAARDKKVDVPKMRELLDMKLDYEKMLRQDIFQQAMIAAQSEMEPVVRDAENKDNHSRYAKLETISRAIKPIYRKHGFTPTYNSRVDANGQKWVTCWLLHTGGHKEFYELPGDIEDSGMRGGKNKTALQGLGVMVSYLRRYLLCMIFDVILIDEDRDGRSELAAEAPPPQDKFAAPVEGVTIDNEVPEWKPEDGVMLQGRTQRLDYSDARTSGTKHMQAVNYLKRVMEKRKHKQSRVALINENLPLIRKLVISKQGSIVADLHALADKGE